MRLLSSSFRDGTAIPRRFTCDGDDLSPPLEWDAIPAGTRSLVLLCDDPDAPGGTWHHWALYNIATERRFFAEGASKSSELKQALNDFQRVGYGGPCPPRGHGVHRYHFRLLALSADHLTLPGRPTCTDVEREARKYLLAEATLIGTYQR